MTSPTRTPTRTGTRITPLLADGTLALRADAAVAEAVAAWVPRDPPRAPARRRPLATLQVGAGEPPGAPTAPAPEIELCTVQGWIGREGSEVRLAEPGGRVGGVVSLDARRAAIRLRLPEAAAAPVEVLATLTIAAAVLLTRLRRALLHAAAVVAPDGRAWLLAAPSFGGKTSTCVTLIRAGWDWISDDAVVLGAGPAGELEAEGWPRRFNLDLGYAEKASRGVRARIDPGELGPGRWRRTAPVAGLLFPRVHASAPTALTRLGAADALSLLLRHTPWLLADRAAGPAVLPLLQQAARLPAFALSLGQDCYCNPHTLQSVLARLPACEMTRSPAAKP